MRTKKWQENDCINTQSIKSVRKQWLRYEWRILTQSRDKQKFQVEMDDLEHQRVEIDVNYSESKTARARINLLGRRGRMNFDLLDDLDRVIRQRGCIRVEPSLFRDGLLLC